MKQHIKELLDEALLDLKRQEVMPDEVQADIKIERARNPDHGHFASNLAMVLAKPAGMNPRELAQRLVDQLPASAHVEKVEIAGPGFINFFLKPGALQHVVGEILKAEAGYGRDDAGSDGSVTVEFVSANPTGPLHVGHGRLAAYGDSLANVLEAVGHKVQREYYLNDAGRQMNILALSVWLRYLELCGEKLEFPENGYRGEYIYDIARDIRERRSDEFRVDGHEVSADHGGDKEKYLDALIARARELLGEASFDLIFGVALEAILDDIKSDLEAFRVVFDRWFSERGLNRSGAIPHAIETLEQNGWVYQRDGARWFKSTEFGDEKDRVLVRKNGDTTYFASDAAYFLDKLERGFDRAVYVFGADHHGYVARLKAAAAGLGADPASMEILLVQFAVLWRGGKKIPMSTRAGEFVTLRELREEVGTDAARYFYIARANDQHLDFDLDLAKAQSTDNPVYYIQYAHARIVSVFKQLEEKGMHHNDAAGEASLDRLTEPQELALMEELMDYPNVVLAAAQNRAPHLIANYLRDLANRFHVWYNAVPFLVDQANTRDARLNLCQATRQVLVNGLGLIGVSAPEKM